MALSSSQTRKAARVSRQRLAWIGFVFCLACATAAAQTYEVLYNFGDPPSPAIPYSALVEDSAGNFYGTTSWGGASGHGTIFKLAPDGTVTVLHSFGDDGDAPLAGLIWDESGNLYGTTSNGGCSPDPCTGTVFKLDPSNTLTTLHAFSSFQEGGDLRGSLIRDEAGNLYGTTNYGGLLPNGSPGKGIAFKLDPSGVMTTLHVFGSGPDSSYPKAGLIRDTAGNLYGTTSGLSQERFGERFDDGSIFRIDAAGTLTTLHSFNKVDGAVPIGGLIRDDSGNLYGTTSEGGTNNLGTIFRLDSSGALTTLYEFTGPDGANPKAALIRDDLGNLYGTTVNGGDTAGTVFRMDSLGNFTRLHSLDEGTDMTPDGIWPRAPLFLDASGNLVGTTPSGGSLSPNGVIFRFNLQAAEPPIITGFSPTVGPSGTDVTISGSGLTGATAVTFNGVASESFSTSPFSITATVPPNATTGKIAVTTTGGTAFSSTNFTVPGPTITSFSPTSGLPGTIVTINGTYFTGVSSVKFNGLVAAFTVLSPTQLTATVPDGTTSGKITVTTPLGTGTSATDFIILPTVTGLFPSSGLPGATVFITGTNFATATAVAFNGHGATFTFDTPTKINATVPSGATTGKVSVTTPAGTAFSATDFTVLSVPTITSFTPTAGRVNTTVTINGTGFTGVSSVKFNDKAAAFHILSSTQLTASVPATTSGKITVTNPAGTATSATDFIVVFKPTVTGFTPGGGVPGTTVVITGTNFDTASAVAFNNWGANFTINSPTQITATVPSSATTGKIKVTNLAGAGWSLTNFVVPTTITSFSPTSGLAGTKVIINGTTFLYANSVTFNGVAANFTINSSIKITATVPSGATSGKIAVTTPGGGTATSATNFMVLPTITSFTPTTGPINTNVTINGTGFAGVSSVKFNGKGAASFNVLSLTQLTAKVSSGTTTGKITVTTPAGTATSATNFIVILPPTVTGFTPGSGVPGTTVVITGTSFDTASAVAFHGFGATFTINSPTKITATVPSTATTGKIKVTNAAGSGSSVGVFVVPPTITSFSPTSGPPGTHVIINGTTFLNANSVTFNGVAANFTINSSIKITAGVPSGATSGKIKVTTPGGGTATSATNFTVLP